MNNQIMKQSPRPTKRTLAHVFGVLALSFLTHAATGKAATLNVVVAGYFGNNTLSDLVTKLPDNTLVDFGVFFSAGSFTTSAALSTALGSVTTDAGMQNFRTNNGWVSFGSGLVSGGVGDFTLLWDLNEASKGPGFGTEFELNPTTANNSTYGTQLNGQNLVGKIPYVWVQTPGATSEYGLFVSNQAFPAAGFGAILQVDVADVGDPAFGVTSLFGLVKSDGTGIATQAIPEPSSAALALFGAGLFALLRRRTSMVNP